MSEHGTFLKVGAKGTNVPAGLLAFHCPDRFVSDMVRLIPAEFHWLQPSS
jgi:hypothetical protein